LWWEEENRMKSQIAGTAKGIPEPEIPAKRRHIED
jgi:hypothetical protein